MARALLLLALAAESVLAGSGAACSTNLPSDLKVESCTAFCKQEQANSHCKRCKCRACPFCGSQPAAAPVTGAAAGSSGKTPSSKAGSTPARSSSSSSSRSSGKSSHVHKLSKSAADASAAPPTTASTTQHERSRQSHPPPRIMLAVMAGGSERVEVLRRLLDSTCASPEIPVRCVVFTYLSSAMPTSVGGHSVPSGWRGGSPGGGRVDVATHQLVCAGYGGDGQAADCVRGRPCCKVNRTARGATPYFCQPHPAATAAHQRRFLPVLAYARQQLEHDDDWVVLLDDDSVVRVHKLIDALATLPSPRQVPYYAGDFLLATGVNFAQSRDGWEPFACGGSASVLSRAAMERTDFGACARRWKSQCYQSDWMIGRCAAEAGVLRVDHHGNQRLGQANASLSCGACGLKCGDAAGAKAVLQRLHAGCAFAQVVFPGGCPSDGHRERPKRRALLRAVCREASRTAVSHLNGCANLLDARAEQSER